MRHFPTPHLMRVATVLSLMIMAVPTVRTSAVAQAAGQSAGRMSVTHLVSTGSVTFHSSTVDANGTLNESSADLSSGDTAHQLNESVPKYPSAPGLLLSVPTPAGSAIASSNPGFTGFAGLNHRLMRLADLDSNNFTRQFSLEPPDQGLCVGGGYVLEAVNDAMGVYSSSTHQLVGLGLEALNPFFNLGHAITRDDAGNAIAFGPSVGDPRCYFDTATGHFFVSAFEWDTDPATGDSLPSTSEYIAVSQTSSPLGGWSIFRIDTTDNTKTADHAGCPCFGDYPQIGADAHGFYLTTNEFSIGTKLFNGAQVYAMSKDALITAAVNGTTTTTTPAVVHISGLSVDHPYAADTLQPAASSSGVFETANGGTEYFVSSLDFRGKLENRVAVWAMTNTSSLNSSAPNVNLTYTVVNTETYGMPPSAQQKAGPTPLADYLASLHRTPQQLALVDGGDDRISGTVTFAGGQLWSALTTVVQDANGTPHTGIAYFVFSPSWAGGSLGASVAKQGYVSVNGENVLYPSIGVNTVGKGVMSFSLVGPDYYPSTAYAPIDVSNGAGSVHVAGVGALPEDGFTGYNDPSFKFTSRGVSRWGDYSAAVAGPDGSIWMSAEYTPNATRTFYANWGTFISNVSP